MNTSRKFDFERTESYLPTPRHRKRHLRDVQCSFVHQFRELTDQEAPVAIVRSHGDPCGDFYRYGIRGRSIPYHWFEDQFWVPARLSLLECLSNRKNRQATIKDIYLPRHGYLGEEEKEEAIVSKLRDGLDNQWAIISGRLCTSIGEPRYVVQTFGLGCNHGGTSIFIEHGYNGNISNAHYFRLDQLEEALVFHKKVALARGDDLSVPVTDLEKVKIIMPETIRCRPLDEHGNGDPYINSVNALAENKNRVLTGLGAILLAIK